MRGNHAAAFLFLPLASFALPGRAATFDVVGVHPDAAAQPTATGRTIATLKAWNGRLYAGYGDYNVNTGPIGVRAFDPATLTFGPGLRASATEALYIFRDVRGTLYAPHVDPIAGESSGGFCRGIPGSPDDAWVDRLPVTAVHVFDVVSWDGTDLWMVGSQGNNAAAWRAADGATFTDPPTRIDPPPSGTSFVRYYFAFVLNGRLHVQSHAETVSRIFDGTSWTDGPDLLPGFGYGLHPENFAGGVVMQENHAGLGASKLIFFDGVSASRPLATPVYDFVVEGDQLLALAARWIAVPGSSGGGYYEPDGVYATTDLCRWSLVAPGAPADARSLEVFGDRLFVGAREAQIFLYSDPLVPLVAGPPPEVQGLRVTRTAIDVALTWQPVTDLGACVEHEILDASAWPLDGVGLFTSRASGITVTTWTHAGAVDDRLFHAYLVQASTPSGTGLLGHYGE